MELVSKKKNKLFVLAFDAWGHWPRGAFSYIPGDFGHFDQCWETKFQSQEEDPIHSIYCLLPLQAALSSDKNLAVDVAICLPGSCRTYELAPLFKSVFAPEEKVAFDLEKNLRCLWHPDEGLQAVQRYAMLALMLTISLVLISTWLEVAKGVNKSNFFVMLCSKAFVDSLNYKQ